MILLLMMDQFIQLPTILLNLKDPISVLTYAIIDNQKTLTPFDEVVDKPVSYIAYDTMTKKYDLRKASAIEAVKKLAEAKYLDYTQMPTGRDKQVFNKYSFPLITPVYKNNRVVENKIKIPFKNVDSSVLSLDLSSKEKGYLLMLHLLSIDTSEIIMSEEEIAQALGITKRTLAKYIKLFTDKKLLFKGRYHYALKDIYKPKTKLTIIL